ncbi:MAG: type II secretion system F family protein, partial [Patescibacteria group bacterium]
MTIGSSRIADTIIEEVSLFLASGMHILPSLKSLEQEVRDRRTKAIIVHMRERVEQGVPFWGALEESGMFSRAVVALIRIGEQTGVLPEHLKLLASILEKNRVLRQRLVSAALYPMLVFGIAFIVGGAITVFILPRLAQVFAQLRVDLPPITQFLLWLGTVIGSVRLEVIGGAVLVTLVILILLSTRSAVQNALGLIFFHIPGIHRMMREVEIGRFGYLCGTMMSAGVPLLDVVQAVAESATLSNYQRLYRSLSGKLELGYGFAESLTAYEHSRTLMPGAVQGMIAAGESSGLLPDTLTKVGAIYEARGEATAKNLTVLLEPILLLVVWFAVLLIAIAVILHHSLVFVQCCI